MKKYVISSVVVALCVSLMASMASATSLTGRMQTIRIGTGTGGSPRVSILMRGNTACSNNGWFAYEEATTGLGALRTRDLLAAYRRIRSVTSVTILGTGSCDAFGVEGVISIDVNHQPFP
jgi:hypothetical protein